MPSKGCINKAFVHEIAKAKFRQIEAEDRSRLLQRKLDAAEMMIKTLTKRLAEKEFKNGTHTGTVEVGSYPENETSSSYW